MTLTRPRLVLILVSVVAALALLLDGASRASVTSVSPVRVFLSEQHPSELITVTNGGAEDVRFEVGVYSWSQSEAGEMQLAPTADIIFFPGYVAIAPGESRNIRVGTKLAAGTREKTYRLFLDELPSRASVSRPRAQVRILSKIGVPIFLRPNSARVSVVVSAITPQMGGFSFFLRNEGNVFAQPRDLTVVAFDEHGAVLLQQHWEPWYLLSGSRLRYEVAVPHKLCAKVRSLKFSFTLSEPASIEKRTTPLGVCAR
ncbi:MAG: fimbria/pilus periplasmic chaperone [Candidatus Eremiobacteraeota bacterium]|nr:fimbria/pilus periplasmic chaperone [Candidatus Eremiobacteraeota bacterium]